MGFIVVIAINSSAGISDFSGQPLELAGRSPGLYGAIVLGDRLFHVLYFVTIATPCAVLRPRWPVHASLLLAAGSGQGIGGATKVLYELFPSTGVGQAYLAADAARGRFSSRW